MISSPVFASVFLLLAPLLGVQNQSVPTWTLKEQAVIGTGDRERGRAGLQMGAGLP